MSVLSQKPPKGTLDWTPNEFKIRSYIFDKWREVCLSYGYREYLTPIVESAELYRAKSGEDVGGNELVTFLDRGGRELCIRPEMTPSVTRMVSKFYGTTQKPIRLFSIANFMRNERPQRGRNREFWQLNVDMFGLSSEESDLEIIEISLEIMLAFNPPKNSFEVHINHRGIIDIILSEIGVNDDDKVKISRILDKWHKLDDTKLKEMLNEIVLEDEAYVILNKFMNSSSCDELEDILPNIKTNESFVEMKNIIKNLSERGYGEYIKFKPDIIRGFDYYDGVIFEVFDNHPDNNRALFGGGRYNGLASLFGLESFPSIGFAPGDEPIKLFLESYGMIEEVLEFKKEDLYYIPMIDDTVSSYVYTVARSLRKEGKSVVCGHIKQTIGKAIDYAEKGDFSHIVIVGAKEKENEKYKICEFRSHKSIDLKGVEGGEVSNNLKNEIIEDKEISNKNSAKVQEEEVIDGSMDDSIKKEENLRNDKSFKLSEKATVLSDKINSVKEEGNSHFFDVEKDSK